VEVEVEKGLVLVEVVVEEVDGVMRDSFRERVEGGEEVEELRRKEEGEAMELE